MKSLLPNSAQRYFYTSSRNTCLLIQNIHVRSPASFSFFLFPSQASLKKFLDYIQTGAIDKMVKVLDKGLDPNFHDADNGGEFIQIILQVMFMFK